MVAYKEDYPVGSTVQIAAASALLEFQRTWKYHHKLEQIQMEYAGMTARVQEVGYYHGGDVLYQLEGLPGLWHEQCLSSAAQ